MTPRPRQDTTVTIRMSQETLDRIEALIDPVQQRYGVIGPTITRADIIRMAIDHGLRVLEREHGLGQDVDTEGES